jgi:hypothetical protein
MSAKDSHRLTAPLSLDFENAAAEFSRREITTIWDRRSARSAESELLTIFIRSSLIRMSRAVPADDQDTLTIDWPNYHSGANGDYQTIAAVDHELLRRPDGSLIEYFPAHPA